MDDELMRRRVAESRVAHLATVRADGSPRVVPCCAALAGDVAYTAVDDVKAKSTLALHRLDDVRSRGRASLLVDRYDEDWSMLWWVRIDGPAHTIEAGDPAHRAAVALLVAKYEQYRDRPPPGAVIALRATTWRAWSA
ncbi:MAG: TIGR03668 family PPOX class F420-dependent oxidoreductase [Acidimicrobiia bacterium]|nr:TIGR03668 family PPOX class F420-dependent oxidoreductase [Acidimicrobiia bacterium]